MSLLIASLNSGSNGNCYYIENNGHAILIDAGLSCRETEKRMTRLGLSIKNVRAIFISHEHTDHIRGVDGIAKKHKLPVYITEPTLRNSRLSFSENLKRTFVPYEAIPVAGLTILAFPKLHDAIDPHSFLVSGNGITIGVLTDIGHACEHVISNFRQCDAVFLEANYDEEMLDQGAYPFYLKARIKSEKGHLSNMQALGLFRDHKPSGLSHLFLAHLSKDNNSPAQALDLFQKHAGTTSVEVASRYEETAVYQIFKNKPSRRIDLIQRNEEQERLQMSLF